MTWRALNVHWLVWVVGYGCFEATILTRTVWGYITVRLSIHASLCDKGCSYYSITRSTTTATILKIEIRQVVEKKLTAHMQRTTDYGTAVRSRYRVITRGNTKESTSFLSFLFFFCPICIDFDSTHCPALPPPQLPLLLTHAPFSHMQVLYI